ncbi:unnamed protein product [Victoria cruziana]
MHAGKGCMPIDPGDRRESYRCTHSRGQRERLHRGKASEQSD